MSQQQRRQASWGAATGAASLAGPIAVPVSGSQPAGAVSVSYIARARTAAFYSEDGAAGGPWGGSPTRGGAGSQAQLSPAAAAAQNAMERLARARGAPSQFPTPPVSRPRPRPYAPPGSTRPPVPAGASTAQQPVREGNGWAHSGGYGSPAAASQSVARPAPAVEGIGSAGVGFRMALAPALTPLERMRQQLAARSLAGLGIEDASEVVAACQDGIRAAPEPATTRQPSLLQPPLVPRRVSFTELQNMGVLTTKGPSGGPTSIHVVSDSSNNSSS